MLPNVTIVTPVRDAAAELPAYKDRLNELAWDDDRLRIIYVEGDSVDGTKELLPTLPGRIVTLNTGRPKYGGVVNPERFRTLAETFNAGLEAVDYGWSDYVLLLPVDIRYDHDLLVHLAAYRVDVVAPFVFMNGRFYDTWGFGWKGKWFSDFTEDTDYGSRLLQMEYVGGTALIDCAVLRAGVRYSSIDVDRGFSRAARAAGYSLWADPTMHVYHAPR